MLTSGENPRPSQEAPGKSAGHGGEWPQLLPQVLCRDNHSLGFPRSNPIEWHARVPVSGSSQAEAQEQPPDGPVRVDELASTFHFGSSDTGESPDAALHREEIFILGWPSS